MNLEKESVAVKKGRPLYRFLPVALNYKHAVERGGNALLVQPLTRKRQAGDDSFFDTFFLLKKESIFINKKEKILKFTSK